MPVHTLERETFIPRPTEEVFEFFQSAANLEELTPSSLRFKILTPQPIEMKQGAQIRYALRVRGIPMRWLTEITEWNPPRGFQDVQLRGPYKLWEHTHRFEPVAGGTRMTDRVRYELPFGWIGEIVHRVSVAREVKSIFDYRSQRIRELFG